jgi:hypothetical protein
VAGVDDQEEIIRVIRRRIGAADDVDVVKRDRKRGRVVVERPAPAYEQTFRSLLRLIISSFWAAALTLSTPNK